MNCVTTDKAPGEFYKIGRYFHRCIRRNGTIVTPKRVFKDGTDWSMVEGNIETSNIHLALHHELNNPYYLSKRYCELLPLKG